MDACKRFRDLLAEEGADAGRMPEAVAHLVRCDACRATWEAYGRAVQAMREADAGDGLVAASTAWLAEAARERRRNRTRVAAMTVLAAGLAAVAAGVAWWSTGDPATPLEPPQAPAVADEPSLPGGLPVVTGDASLQAEGAAAVAVLATAVVAEGQSVVTGAGEAVLADPGTARVSLAPRTRMVVERWRPESAVLRLQEGSLEAQVKRREPGQSFEVRTPEAVVRVVGTRFVVTRRTEGATEIVGLEGEVTVETAEGRLVAHVTAGRSVRMGPERAVPAVSPAGAAPRARDGAQSSGPRPAAEIAVPEAVLAEARRLLSEGQDEAALAMLRRAVEAATPQDRARMLSALADAYRLAGRWAEAAGTWERCLAAGPGPAPESAYLDYAGLLAAQGRSAEAARVREAYLQAWPSGRHLGAALRELALFAELDGRPEDAAELRRRLVRDAPRSREAVEVFVDVGLRMARAGDLEGAARWFDGKRGAESRELAEAAWVGLLRVRFEEGRFDLVRDLATAYRRIFPVGERRDEVDRMMRALPSETPSNP